MQKLLFFQKSHLSIYAQEIWKFLGPTAIDYLGANISLCLVPGLGKPFNR